MSDSVFRGRIGRLRSAARAAGADAVLTSVGADTPWLCGYEAMPLERLTMLVIPSEGDVTLVVPKLEAARVVERPSVFSMLPWAEGEDPIHIVSGLIRGAGVAAIGDRTWSGFTLALQRSLPATDFVPASPITGRLRAVKDPSEMAALSVASRAADVVANQLRTGGIPLIGRTEAEVSADLGRRLLAEGHARVNFAIVAAGPNAASPHHEPSARTIEPGEVVLCDFGGTYVDDDTGVGYCSDITRCVWTGEPDAHAAEVYEILRAAQDASVESAVVGAACEDVDRAARGPIAEGGFADFFIHRTGHGIGVEEHEDPYIVEGNTDLVAAGNAFSVEPGIYLPGRFGFRIEDIVLATPAGPRRLNDVDRRLASVG